MKYEWYYDPNKFCLYKLKDEFLEGRWETVRYIPELHRKLTLSTILSKSSIGGNIDYIIKHFPITIAIDLKEFIEDLANG